MSKFSIKEELKNLSPTNPHHVLALGFGSGLSPIIPGTIGTLAAIPFYLILSYLTPMAYLAAIVLGLIVGIYSCHRTTRDIGIDDHGGIVWDEFIGFFITMIGAPAGWGWIVIGFILFRIFDILKPQPIRWIDSHLSGGLGIMLDDVLAGAMALIVLQALAFFIL